ncbi:MAG: glycosyltransferase family 39 protein [Candidatus Shapirobacteria bacterium]|nr:glycosyltransferase family 39 protein [Candidatus Shapirobacteria bacterium]MDD4410782.1 glycosyltransferase family 39 protein [Candidatus Shapirobacteria bacterium]
MTIKNCFYLIKSKKNIFLLLSILSIALFFRTIGFNWDQNQHLHPDERFLTMVLTTIKIPTSLSQYLNPQTSTLNPYNNNFSFFVYGAFPLNLVKIAGEFLNKITYDQIHFVGRGLTILADVLIVLLIYLISQKIFNQKIALLSSFFYSICVLPIQLSHFYTVDPFLNLFIVLSFYFLVIIKDKKNIFKKVFLLSLSFGIALSCKISAIYFLPVIFIYFLFIFYKNPKLLIFYGLIFVLFTSLIFRFNQPQAFSSGNLINWNLNPQFISNLKELQSYNQMSYYPPGIQWLKTIPLIFPLKNIILWGAGLPLGIIFILSIFYSIIKNFKSKIKNYELLIIIFWILLLFFYQGIQHVTTMRYFLPIYPFLCISSAFFIHQTKLLNLKLVKIFFFIILLIYPICFISIYLKDHTRVTASKWIYQNIPIGSTLATEYWDDSLPLFLKNKSIYDYQYQSLAIADSDSQEKISIIKDQLIKSDYIIISSNRFYLPIPRNSNIYPLTAKYYQSLFDGSLGFKQVAEFTSYPVFNDTSAEEAFTVYDHPKVLIFQKTSAFSLNSF